MIKGIFNADREATIPLRVSGRNGQERDIVAMIDTGFNGYLTLPPAMIAELECPFLSYGTVIVGDGRVEDLEVYVATVVWDGQPRTVETDASETEPLVGMSLIYGYDLWIRAIDGAAVSIDKVP